MSGSYGASDIEVLSGLDPQSAGSVRVVTVGAAGLRDGDSIEAAAGAGEVRK